MLCDTTPCRASVAMNGLWRVAARTWHEPHADTCSMVSASPSHPRLVKIIFLISPCFSCDFLWDIAAFLNQPNTSVNTITMGVIAQLLISTVFWVAL